MTSCRLFTFNYQCDCEILSDVSHIPPAAVESLQGGMHCVYVAHRVRANLLHSAIIVLMDVTITVNG